MTEKTRFKFDRVMVIDDSSVDLYIMSRIIVKNKFGREILKYSSATEALNYLEKNQENEELWPQAIFVDIHMPLMSGFEFMEAYDKLRPDFKNCCQAYIVSSTIDPRDITRAHSDVNIIDFHEKPITAEFLTHINSELRDC